MRPHSTEWYMRLSTLQQGYFYPWQSNVAAGNGEDAYLELVHAHLGAEIDLLDVGCGHGALTLDFARNCRSALGYDLVPSYIEMAQTAAHAQSMEHVTFLCYDSSIPANQGKAHIPAADSSFDVMICGKGPFHWIEDARRVGRPNASMLMLIPDGIPMPHWHDQLPKKLQWSFGNDPTWARTAMETRLNRFGIELHSWWSFDVPEYFTDPKQLYTMFAWGHTAGEKPAYDDVAPELEAIFAEHATSNGLALRHRRHVWKAIIDK